MEHRTSKTTALLALMVVALFALCLVLVVLSGAGVYRGLVRRGEEQFTRRTAVQYIATRVRQAQTVAVEDFHGCQALVISETVDQERYLTRVYCYDGWLWELYCEDTADLEPEDGEKLLETDPLVFRQEGRLLEVHTEGQSLHLHLRGGA